ncbi:MAG: hypothetical protein V1723_03700 [Candidatus Uhrbacteria bacterium]
MEREPTPNNAEKKRLATLADELDRIQPEETGNTGNVVIHNVVIQKLIRHLRDGDACAAKTFLANQADKFTGYGGDAVAQRLIIEQLYGGNGSPWLVVERRMKDQQSNKEPEPLK